MATSHVDDPVLDPKPTEYDVHVYQSPSTLYLNIPIFQHSYISPLDWFAKNAFYYDDFKVGLCQTPTCPIILIHLQKRDGTKYFEGEYAAISTNDSDVWSSIGRLKFPTMQSMFTLNKLDRYELWLSGASGEAAFMTGLERNSDIV
jgi:alpha-L-arabinofuranosidase